MVYYPLGLSSESDSQLMSLFLKILSETIPSLLVFYLFFTLFPMTTKKKLLNALIIFILAVFLLSTALISVLYLGGNNTWTDENLSWDTTLETWTLDTPWVEQWLTEVEIVPIWTDAPIIITTGTK